jgi:hypothetical protein
MVGVKGLVNAQVGKCDLCGISVAYELTRLDARFGGNFAANEFVAVVVF